MKTKEKKSTIGAIAIGVRLIENAQINEATREIPVLIIKEGMGNKVDRHFYSAELLHRVAPKFDGVKAYANHPSKAEEKDRPERDIRDIVGHYHSPKVVMVEGKSAIEAILKINGGDAYSWAWDLVKEAAAFAKKFPAKEYVGISINAWGASHVHEADGEAMNMVDDLTEVQSADIVTAAGAGGGFRLREAIQKALGTIKEAHMNKDNLAKFGEGLKALHEAIMGNPDHAKAYGPAMEALMAGHSEMIKGCEAAPGAAPAAGAPAPAPAPAKPEEAAKGKPDMKALREKYSAGKMTAEEKVLFETILEGETAEAIRLNKDAIEKALIEAKIPEAFTGDLRLICAGRPEAEVKALVEARKKLVESIHGQRAQGAGAGASDKKPVESKFQERAAAAGLPLKKAA